MSRLELLPENQLVSLFKEMRDFFRGYKATQPQSGKSGMVNYMSESTLTWDSTATVSSPSPNYYNSLKFTVDFESAHRHEWPVVVPYLELYINSVNEASRLNGQNRLFGSDWSAYTYGDFGKEEPQFFDNKWHYRWTIYLSYAGTITYFFKARVVGSDTGVVTVTVGAP